MEEVLGMGYIEQNQYLRVFMAQLRKKVEDEPSKPKLLNMESVIGLPVRQVTFQYKFQKALTT